MRRYLLAVLVLLAIQYCPTALAADWLTNERAGEKAYACGHFDECIKSYSAALQQAKSFGSGDPRYVLDLDYLARAYQGLEKFELAEPLFKQARTYAAVFAPDDPKLAIILADVGHFYRQQGYLQDAEPLLKQAVAIDEKVLVGKDRYLAEHLNGLGVLYLDWSKLDKAEPLFKKALAMDDAFRPDDSDTADLLDNLGALYLAQDKDTEAETTLKRSLAIRKKVHGPKSEPVADSLENLAEVESRTAYLAADDLYTQALAITEKNFGPSHPMVANRLDSLANFCDTCWHDAARTESLYKRALAIRVKAYGPKHFNTGVSISNLALFCSDHNRDQEAERYYKQALSITDSARGPFNQASATTLYNLASLYDTKEDYESAVRAYKRSLNIREKIYGQIHPDVSSSLRDLATDLVRLNKYAEAELVLTRALAIDKQLPKGEKSQQSENDMQQLLLLYEKQGKYFASEAMYKRLVALLQEAVQAGKPEAAKKLLQQMSEYANYLLNKDKVKPVNAKVVSHKKDPDESRRQTKLGSYIARFRVTDNGVSEFSLTKDGKQILRRTPTAEYGVIQFVDPIEKDDTSGAGSSGDDSAPTAKDINGDGIPDLIYLDVRDDPHCCCSCTIMALGEHGPKVEFTHEFGESRPSFEDLNHDGRLEIVVEDTNYIGWNCCVPGSPKPRVVLAWNGSTWVPSTKFMAAPEPTAAQLVQIVNHLKKEDGAEFKPSDLKYIPKGASGECINPQVWGKMLDLIYSGNAPAAHELLKRMWTGNAVLDIDGCLRRPYSVKYRERFWNDLVDRVKVSDYLLVVRQLNPGMFLGPPSKTPTMRWELPF